MEFAIIPIGILQAHSSNFETANVLNRKLGAVVVDSRWIDLGRISNSGADILSLEMVFTGARGEDMLKILKIVNLFLHVCE